MLTRNSTKLNMININTLIITRLIQHIFVVIVSFYNGAVGINYNFLYYMKLLFICVCVYLSVYVLGSVI